MKISVNSLGKTSFRPFEVVILIETERDLEAISSLTNASNDDMASFLNKNKYYEQGKDFIATEEAVKRIQDVCSAVTSR